MHIHKPKPLHSVREFLIGRGVSGDLIKTTDRQGVVPDPDIVEISQRKAAKCLEVLGQSPK